MVAGSFASTAHGIPRTTQGVDMVIDPPSPAELNAGGSERQRRDVAGILATARTELDREYVERWVGDLDLADVWQAAQATSI